jgi:hypothetical protein
MKITNNDIDALIEASVVLNGLAFGKLPSHKCDALLKICHHVRKVYILLLNASGREIIDLKQMTVEGFVCKQELEEAINRLCNAIPKL